MYHQERKANTCKWDRTICSFLHRYSCREQRCLRTCDEWFSMLSNHSLLITRYSQSIPKEWPIMMVSLLINFNTFSWTSWKASLWAEQGHHTWCIFQHFFCNAAVFGHIINHRMFRFRERVEKNSFLSTHTSDSSKFIACFCDDHFTVHSKNGSILWFSIRLYTLLEYCTRSFLCPRRKQILVHPQHHSFYTILSIKNVVVH